MKSVKQIIIDQIQLAISKPENSYMTPYSPTSDKKDHLRIQMLNTRKSAESVYNLIINKMKRLFEAVCCILGAIIIVLICIFFSGMWFAMTMIGKGLIMFVLVLIGITIYVSLKTTKDEKRSNGRS